VQRKAARPVSFAQRIRSSTWPACGAVARGRRAGRRVLVAKQVSPVPVNVGEPQLQTGCGRSRRTITRMQRVRFELTGTLPDLDVIRPRREYRSFRIRTPRQLVVAQSDRRGTADVAPRALPVCAVQPRTESICSIPCITDRICRAFSLDRAARASGEDKGMFCVSLRMSVILFAWTNGAFAEHRHRCYQDAAEGAESAAIGRLSKLSPAAGEVNRREETHISPEGVP
jgi:hypothetical protein